MASRKLLTIATINLNDSSGLIRTINSFSPLRNEDDIEFLYQDGGSVDNSMDVARAFYYSHEIKCEGDKGIYDAMNRTIHRASGEYILWINSGDEILSGEWDFIRKELLTCSADMHLFSISIVDENGVISYVQSNGYDIAKGVPHQSTIFKVATVKNTGGYDESYRIAGDYDLILRLARNNATVWVGSRTISVFYVGGVSGTPGYWKETWRALHSNCLLSGSGRLLNNIKLFFVLSNKNLFRFRLKRTSVLGAEKNISLYDIGAVPMNVQAL